MSRTKLRKFQFSIPITEIKNSDGLFQVQKAGEMLITATGKIAASLEDMPLDFAENGEVKIIIESIEFNGVDIAPIFRLPDAKPLLAMVNRASWNHLKSILEDK